MKKILFLVIGIGLLIGTAGVTYALTKIATKSETMKTSADAAPLDIAIDIRKKHTCSRLSPEMRVEGLPKGTARLQVSVLDLNIGYDHRGGIVAPAEGGRIAEGALVDYVGPCPRPTDHSYRFRVNALSEINEIIGIAEKTVRCCSTVSE